MTRRDPATDGAATRRRMSLVLEGARACGLLEGKTEQVAARINPSLLHLAKERTGIQATSALIELAIANLAVEDGFPEAFARSRASVPADLDLEL